MWQASHPRRKKPSPVYKRLRLAKQPKLLRQPRLSQRWLLERRQVRRLPSSTSPEIRLNSRSRVEPMSGIRTAPERTMAVRHNDSESAGAESRNVLIVSDDPGFARELSDRWQQ